jgi:hyperosmotically inducible periplasmic protein
LAEHQSRHQDHQKPFNPPGVVEPFNHDAHMIKEIKDALMRQTESAGIDIKVSAEDGAVRLYGIVDVLAHKLAAQEIVQRIAGVRHIDNDLTVANEETYTDRDILEEVSGKFAANETVRNIGCRVHKGVVTLVGHAVTSGDIQTAVRMASDVIGVRDVRVDRVKVGEGEKEDDADVSRAAEACLDRLGCDHTLFQVYCDAGVLFVKGFVPTAEDRSRVKTELHKIPGVDKLEATLITDDQVASEVH